MGFYRMEMPQTPDEPPATPENSPMEPVLLLSALGGRMRNISRLKSWYMAIAEVAQNAMDSIKDSSRQGNVIVEIHREGNLLSPEEHPGHVQGVTVYDDGDGFNPDNFTSFCTPDSQRKQSAGGKGLGRLACLQAFRQIEGHSVYEEGNKRFLREFLLQCEDPVLRQRNQDADAELPISTKVHLKGLRPEHTQAAEASFEKIVEWLCEHFLATLVEKPSWLISFVVREGESTVDLTAKVSGSAVWKESFAVNHYEFHGACYSIRHNDSADQVRLVASGRVVHANTRGVDHYLPHLDNIGEKKGHVVLVKSPFFDEHVNDARNGVPFQDDSEEGAPLGVTAAQFREGLGEAMKRQLGSRLEACDQRLRQRVESVVAKEATYYRPLLRGYFNSKEFSTISQYVRNEEILASIDSHKRREAASMKKESKKLAKMKSENAGWEASAKSLAAKIETQRQVALAEYVSLRKLVLDQLENIMGIEGEGRAHLEETIHNLVFPQHTDSESTVEIPHQLWILDERLESHAYLASDRQLRKKGDRPDLLLAFDHPGAFASEPKPKAGGYERIVIVEFKRPLKEVANVPTDDLPHRQMMRYAKQIVDEKTEHFHTKRKIKTSKDVRFYLYAVCELSNELLERLKTDEGFIPSPTGDGAFCVKNEGRYYLEYISLEKLLDDAKARNAAFFRRLGLD